LFSHGTDTSFKLKQNNWLVATVESKFVSGTICPQIMIGRNLAGHYLFDSTLASSLENSDTIWKTIGAIGYIGSDTGRIKLLIGNNITSTSDSGTIALGAYQVCQFSRREEAERFLQSRIFYTNEKSISDSTIERVFSDSLQVGINITNRVKLDTTGIKLFGKAQKFDDMGDMLLTQGVTNGSGHGTPTLTIAANSFAYYAFAIGSDSVQCICEEKHKFVEGDSGHIQFMWRNNGIDGTNRVVKWSIHCNVTNPGDSSTYDTTVAVQDTIFSTDKSLKFHYNDICDWYVPNSKIGSVWDFMVKRVAPSGGTAPTNNPFGVRVGVHKKVNGFGSTGETSPQ
jgi:hypothetical protein